MRGWSLAWLAAATAAAVAVFVMKHEVRTLERELGGLNRQILANEEALHVLHAEWAYLNRPARLERLGRDLLGLAPMDARQTATAAWLGLDRPEAPDLQLAKSEPQAAPEPAPEIVAASVRPAPPPLPPRRPDSPRLRASAAGPPAVRPKSNDVWIAELIVALKESP